MSAKLREAYSGDDGALICVPSLHYVKKVLLDLS